MKNAFKLLKASRKESTMGPTDEVNEAAHCRQHWRIVRTDLNHTSFLLFVND